MKNRKGKKRKEKNRIRKYNNKKRKDMKRYEKNKIKNKNERTEKRQE